MKNILETFSVMGGVSGCYNYCSNSSDSAKANRQSEIAEMKYALILGCLNLSFSTTQTEQMVPTIHGMSLNSPKINVVVDHTPRKGEKSFLSSEQHAEGKQAQTRYS